MVGMNSFLCSPLRLLCCGGLEVVQSHPEPPRERHGATIYGSYLKSYLKAKATRVVLGGFVQPLYCSVGLRASASQSIPVPVFLFNRVGPAHLVLPQGSAGCVFADSHVPGVKTGIRRYLTLEHEHLVLPRANIFYSFEWAQELENEKNGLELSGMGFTVEAFEFQSILFPKFDVVRLGAHPTAEAYNETGQQQRDTYGERNQKRSRRIPLLGRFSRIDVRTRAPAPLNVIEGGALHTSGRRNEQLRVFSFLNGACFQFRFGSERRDRDGDRRKAGANSDGPPFGIYVGMRHKLPDVSKKLNASGNCLRRKEWRERETIGKIRS
ncbi:hypothetical protein B0H14DRAFT_2587020 [Mycena olivaceomarginata]|nr:hypothetical protein B0H14DRAFT_2587020 [Mycena olivaceomarginata]